MGSIGTPDSFQLLGKVNLNHLLYFWAVGQTGSVTRAAARLGVSQPSVSEQVRTLEKRLGTTLLERGPRGVRLTAEGRHAMRYAEELIGVCTELVRSIPITAEEPPRPLIIGVADVVPKIIARSILRPLLDSEPPTQVVCREWRVDSLLAELSLHRMDMVISDSPPDASESSSMRTYPAMSATIELVAAPKIAARVARGFPNSLEHVPMLLPTQGTSLRASIDRWLAIRRLRPRIAAEADDRSLLHHFAEEGLGVVPVSAITRRDLTRQFGLVRAAPLRDMHEQYFVTIIEHSHPHPGVPLVLDALARSAPRAKRS